MAFHPYVRQVELPIGITSATLLETAPIDSSIFSVAGFDTLDLFVSLDYTAATKLTFTLYLSDKDDGSELFQSTAQATTAGVVTVSKQSFEIATGSADIAVQLKISNLSARSAKLHVVGANGTTDLITVRGIASVS